MIMKNGTKGIHRLLGLLLALTMLLSLVAPVLNVAYAQPDEGIGSESVEEAAEEQVPEPHEEEALPVEDTETEEQEEETEPVTEWEDPVSETEEDVTPDPEVEDETEEPDVTEDAVEEEEETEEATEEEEEEPEEPEDMPEMGDNPDHLPGPIYIDAPQIVQSMAGRFQLLANNMGLFADDLAPGEVRLNKTATPVSGMVNTWNIELEITARNTEETSDIVLVIDTSGSMRDNGRMDAAKAAARNFVNTLLPESGLSNTRIALVPYASNVGTKVDFTSNRQTLLNAINGLSANGGTFTQAGLHQADEYLDGSNADHKNIVLLSDGVPTYSYAINRPREYVQPYGSHYETIIGVPQSAFNYGTAVGDGTGLRFQFDSDGWFFPTRYYYNHGNSAIAEAGFAKDKGRTVYTVALEAGSEGETILNQTASPGKSFKATPSDLNAIFQTIAGDISSAARNATVTDPMGTGFVVPAGQVSNIEKSRGTATYNAATKTIDWQVGTVQSPTANPLVKREWLRYTVEIDDAILDVPVPGDGLYATNGETPISYTDINGEPQTKYFTSPKVDPILLIVEKVLKNDKGEVITEDERVFDVKITSNNGYDQTYPVSAGHRKVMTNLRLEDTYTVAETNVSGPSKVEDYETTINIYGENTKTFVINQGDPDTTVRVTNQEKSLGKLTVKKVFYNMPEPAENVRDRGLQVLQTPLIFDFVLTKPDDTTEEFSLTADGTKVFENLPYGVYKVEETTTGYTTVYDPANGKVELTFDNREATVTVSNRVLGNDAVTATKKWTGELQPVKPDVWFKLYRESAAEEKHAVPNAEIKKLPTGPDAEYTVSWDDVPEYDEKGNAYTYSVQEVYEDGSNYVPGGYSKTEDGLTVSNKYLTINIKVTKVWKNTSTYPEKVTIKLLADGVDTGKTLELTAENNWTGTFEVLDEYSNGEKIEYTISEVHLADYETTYSGNAKDGFVVTNTRIYTPPTGINLDFLPYVLLLAVAGVGIGATILRKRKNEA
jgi:hypothetical protein